MKRLLLFCAVLATMFCNYETSQLVICERLLYGMFCLPGTEADPDIMKSLLDFSDWELLKNKIQAGKKIKGLEEQEEDQELEKRGMRFKDGRIRILRLPEDIGSN